MLRNWMFGLFFMVLPYCVPLAIANPATGDSASATSYAFNVPGMDESLAKAIKDGTASPEQYFEAANIADKADDVIASAILYRFAADGGHAVAQVRTGGMLYGSGFYEKAAHYYLKAAEQGNADGMYGLAMVIMDEYKETEFKGDLPGNDLAGGRKWLEQAAELGHEASLAKVASAYIYGGLGLDNDALNSPEALSWIKRAADADFVPAVEALAKAHRTGQYGLTADPVQADELDAKARKLLGIKDTKKKKKRSM